MEDFTNGQRRHPRYDVPALSGVLRQVLEARLLEWGADGLTFESGSWLAPGQRLSFRFRQTPRKHAVVSGGVVSSQLVGNRHDRRGDLLPVYRSVVELNPASPAEARALVSGFERLGELWREHRPGRFEPPEPVPVRLELEYDLEVRRLSRSGMLAETGVSPDLESRHDLEIVLDRRVLRPRGRVAYRQAAASRGRRLAMQIGLEFIDMDRKDDEALDSFLAELDPLAGSPRLTRV